MGSVSTPHIFKVYESDESCAIRRWRVLNARQRGWNVWASTTLTWTLTPSVPAWQLVS